MDFEWLYEWMQSMDYKLLCKHQFYCAIATNQAMIICWLYTANNIGYAYHHELRNNWGLLAKANSIWLSTRLIDQVKFCGQNNNVDNELLHF